MPQKLLKCSSCKERFVTHVPEQVGRTRHLAHAWNELGQVERARAHYDRVLAAAAGDHEARRGRALALWRLGRVGEGGWFYRRSSVRTRGHEPKRNLRPSWVVRGGLVAGLVSRWLRGFNPDGRSMQGRRIKY